MKKNVSSIRLFLFKWMIANTVGVIVGGWLGVTFYQVWRAQTFEQYDYLIDFLIFGALFGLLLGTTQWFVLRAFGAKAHTWILATFAGWSASFSLGLLLGFATLTRSVDLNDRENMILGIWTGVLGGFGAGFLQWLCNQRLNLKWQWALVNGFAWSASLGVTFYFVMNKVGFEDTRIYGWVLMAILPGTIAGLVSGLPLGYWLHAPDVRDTGEVFWNNL